MRAASLSGVVDAAEEARSRQRAERRALRQLARRVLQAEGAHLLGRRPDEDDAGLLARSAKSAFSDRKP